MVAFQVLPITQRLGNSLRERCVRRKAVVPLREGPPHLRFRARGYRFVSRGYRFARGRHNCGFVPGGIASRAGGIASRGAVPVVFFFPWVSLREGSPHVRFLGGRGSARGWEWHPLAQQTKFYPLVGRGARGGGGLVPSPHTSKEDMHGLIFFPVGSCFRRFSLASACRGPEFRVSGGQSLEFLCYPKLAFSAV